MSKKIKINLVGNKFSHLGGASIKGTIKQPIIANQAEPSQKKKQIATTAQLENNGKLTNIIMPQNIVANLR
ncbi:hypothetical protein QUF74_14470 [Candidatus Halobeggiatoa sp. HSG11]|nr:hypothetical protein [Candidatus Halobeggiatoa sp. HSG11]